MNNELMEGSASNDKTLIKSNPDVLMNNQASEEMPYQAPTVDFSFSMPESNAKETYVEEPKQQIVYEEKKPEVMPSVDNTYISNNNSVLQDELVKNELNPKSYEELIASYKSIIDDEDMLKDVIRRPGDTLTLDAININAPLTEEYKEVSDNTFSMIFDPNKIDSIKEEEQKDVFMINNEIPTEKERMELAPPPNNRGYRKANKRIIPKGYGIGIVIFVLLYIFVINIDAISYYINEFMYKYSK